jgi:hypothetical protein
MGEEFQVLDPEKTRKIQGLEPGLLSTVNTNSVGAMVIWEPGQPGGQYIVLLVDPGRAAGRVLSRSTDSNLPGAW